MPVIKQAAWSLAMKLAASPVLQAFAIVVGGLLAGSVFGIWRGYDPAPLSAEAFLEVHQGAVRGLNTLLPLMGLSTILATAALAYLADRGSAAFRFYLAAMVGMIAGGVVTRFGNQPINAAVMEWSVSTMPEDWQALRDAWWSWHQARLASTVIGFVMLVIGVLSDRRVDPAALPAPESRHSTKVTNSSSSARSVRHWFSGLEASS